MKPTTKIFQIWLFTFLASFLLIVGAAAQAEKNLIKTINVEDKCTPVFFYLGGDVAVNEWDKETIRIETKVGALNMGEKTLDLLLHNGRYNLEIGIRQSDGAMIIQMPGRNKVITMGYTDLEENMTFEIFVPKDIYYEIIDPRLNGVL